MHIGLHRNVGERMYSVSTLGPINNTHRHTLGFMELPVPAAGWLIDFFGKHHESLSAYLLVVGRDGRNVALLLFAMPCLVCQDACIEEEFDVY